LDKKNITPKQLHSLLSKKINEVSFVRIKDDVVRFIKDNNSLQIWSFDYFHDFIEKMKIE
jgi:hypothetical protein